MLAKRNIETTLLKLDQKYLDPQATNDDRNYYSKLALMELCGWIEQSVDKIAKEYASSRIVSTNELRSYEADILDKLYSFKYKKIRKDVLIYLVGIIGTQKIEARMGADLSILKSTLGSLASTRNRAAHTYIKGVTMTYDAPSLISAYLRQIYTPLCHLKKELHRIRK